MDELIDIAGAQENVLTTEFFDELVVLAEDVSKVACGKETEIVRHSLICKTVRIFWDSPKNACGIQTKGLERE